jgi:lysozyme
MITPPLAYSDAALKALTEDSEGCRLEAYPDPGTGGDPWTIGYGHTGPDVYSGLVITQDRADALLRADMTRAVDAVNRLVSAPVDQYQFDALCDFAFNCGSGNFAKSTLLIYVNQGRFEEADAEFGKWIRGGGRVLPGLVKRRALESKWFAT